ncbi:hypothetical protein M422DRAFT_267917 [Sphaerobolus stellatus SS14]|uniref:Uncharacterized protein n=1 Tax=Sphaerobolus stellatus (strain SS14) TaxID=990650 RepID=A0A0C9U7Z7_SPHS4|nr:hypothetical protein M422DRAFT_267917 [Sphaerobolus stellatus SS14]
MDLAWVLNDVEACDKHYEAHTASHQASCEPEKALAARPASHGQTLSGLTPVPEDSYADQPEFSNTEGTLTGTPNPLGGGDGSGGPPSCGGPNLNSNLDPKGADGSPNDDNNKALN